MKKLHLGVRWMFRLNFYRIFLGLIVFFIILGIVISSSPEDKTILAIMFSIVFIFIVLLIIIGEIYTRMSYNRWLYEFAEDDLKIEKGIIWKKYSNIPYKRVQNVDITRGIIARIFGFSSVNVQTAGYSGPNFNSGWRINGMNSEGYIPAVDMQEAEKIREFLMKKISKKN